MKSAANASVPPRTPLVSLASLGRQSSIYNLTFEELQTTFNDSGKNFGSMNMEEFLKNIWTAEETQAMAAAMSGISETGASPLRSGHCPPMHLPRQNSMQRQNSISVPRNISGKTVDEVWKEIHRPSECATTNVLQQRTSTMGETTLEEFLAKAGILREESEAEPSTNSNNSVVTGLTSSTQSDAVQTPQARLCQRDWLKFNVNSIVPQQILQYQPNQVAPTEGGFSGRYMTPTAVGLPSATTSSILDSPFDGTLTLAQNGSTLSPALAMHDRKRPLDPYEEKSIEQRQKRMIKNRESAARSRARKQILLLQAYTVELESEVEQLKEEQNKLKKQQAEDMKKRKTQLMEILVPVTVQPKAQRRLRRTQSTLW